MYFRGWILWSPRFLLSHFWLIGKYIFEVFACFCALNFEHPRPNNRHTQDNICEVGGRTWPSCASRKHVVSVTHVGNRGGWLWRCRGTRSGSRCGDWGSGRDTPGISRGEEWGVGRGVWVWWECFWEDFNPCRSVSQRYGRSKYGRVNPDNMGNWNGGRRGGGVKRNYFSSMWYGRVCDNYQHLNRVNRHICLIWIHHRSVNGEFSDVINQVLRG